MLCPSCNKLVILNSKKKCIRCQGVVQQNIAILCESCSAVSKSCAICLRKIYKNLDNPIYKNMGSGCKSCGRK
jgi:hypothetical protein